MHLAAYFKILILHPFEKLLFCVTGILHVDCGVFSAPVSDAVANFFIAKFGACNATEMKLRTNPKRESLSKRCFPKSDELGLRSFSPF